MTLKTTLSAQESKPLLKLAWEKKRLLRLDEIARVLKVSRDHAYKIASVLCDKSKGKLSKEGLIIQHVYGTDRLTKGHRPVSL